MNNQELIEYCESLKGDLNKFINGIDVNKIIAKIEQLDEPQKPVVKQFVADWIEEGKKHCKDVSDLFDFDFTNEEVGKWFLQEKPFDLVARAWLDGYEIEKEKKYEVILCNGQSLKTVYRQGDDRLDFEKVYGDLERFTRKQLEDAGFGWMFDCEGIVVREVE